MQLSFNLKRLQTAYFHNHWGGHLTTPWLLPNRSPAAWGTQESPLDAHILCSSSQNITCWAPNFLAFALLGSLKYC